MREITSVDYGRGSLQKRNKYFMESNNVCRVYRLRVCANGGDEKCIFYFHFMFAAATLHIIQFQFKIVV